MKFCLHCGSRQVRYQVPPMDNRERFVCQSCGYVHYENPNMVVGCIPVWEDRILLCRRAINPRRGLWTLPAGFMELGESAPQGACRETMEEANVQVEIDALFALFSLPYLDQVYLMYRASMLNEQCSPGLESSQVALFQQDQIPWEQIAFASIYYTLKLFFEDREQGDYRLHTGEVLRKPDHYQLQLHPGQRGNLLFRASAALPDAAEQGRRKYH